MFWRRVAVVVSSGVMVLGNAAVADPRMTLYSGGDILTMEGSEPRYVEALLEHAGRIAYAGTQRQARAMAGGDVRVVDLAGATLLPGLIDAHGHFIVASHTLLNADLSGVRTIPELIARLKVHAASVPPGEWIEGMGYRLEQLEERRHPTTSELDQVSEVRPVFIQDGSGHQGAINRVLQRQMGWQADAPPGEARVFALMQARPPRSPQRIREGVQRAVALWTQHGQTTASELGLGLGGQDLAVVKHIQAEPLLPIDLAIYAKHDWWERLGPQQRGNGRYDNRVRWSGVKVWLDGNTSELARRSASDPGQGVEDLVQLLQRLRSDSSWPAARQLAAHAVGDQAADQLLQAVNQFLATQGPLDHRTVLHHGVVLRPDQIEQVKRLGVVVSFTAAGLYPMGDALTRALGPERQGWLGPIGSVQRTGRPFTLHHDLPAGVSPSLMDALWSAVTRTSRSGAVLQPQERITPYAGLQALTRYAAYQLFEEQQKGTLAVGKLADLVVLDANPLKVDPMAIRQIKVLATIKEGKEIYRSPQWNRSVARARQPVAHQDETAVPKAAAEQRPTQKRR
ncbi:amidohydrolase family protein [Vulcanococcus sp. Clear-D1]|uniref:amidohydrolase n=1 Tax=Vulcanococcus sp. Clear-D1 TaxID=2766970 RepID=UPI0019A66F19|nr:amidohydrolase family protein [Vulcanococcus sp. Clear-D1]MBD1193156.1 amidohydrolase family protein [Vulcanococcus sp. Clear-D1]